MMIARLFLAFLIFSGASGCAPYRFFSARTTVTYEVDDTGKVKRILYDSDKEQSGLEVKMEKDEHGNIRAVDLKVEKAGSSTEVLAAMMQSQVQMLNLLKSLLDKGALAAGS